MDTAPPAGRSRECRIRRDSITSRGVGVGEYEEIKMVSQLIARMYEAPPDKAL